MIKMKITVLKTLVLLAGIVIMLNAGCEKEQVSTSRKARLIAVENTELKKQLQQRDIEIEELKEKYEGELKDQKELLEQAEQDKKVLDEQLSGKFQGQIDEMMAEISKGSSVLVDENENLKQQIEELKAELEAAKAPK